MTQAEYHHEQENAVTDNGSMGSFTSSVTSKSISTASYKSHGVGMLISVTTMHTTIMAMLKQAPTARKTYGARRCLNSGWDTRKRLGVNSKAKSSSAMVLLMVPGLGFLYSSLARRKSTLSMMWACMGTGSVITF